MIDEKAVFGELDRKLGEEDLELTVICVGGFVLSHYGMRATQDIDAFFRTTKSIERIIKEVGEKFRINKEDELWLNNSVQNMNAWPPLESCEVLYDFPNLKVLMPKLEYIAGMKMLSGREIDVDDAAAIIRKKKIRTPDDLIEKLGRYGIDWIDEDVLLESFGRAYGMEWLEAYYKANEEVINARIMNSK